ncbi:conserved hypothetical protein [Pediculus humanus corporis]|uniref:MPN domain-containing protein n=1 Tax=Pediculus humanus subsp. corporis TaxID=121224 RepID=E0VL46_PEDHC|nr:uncharacterized protein Phum_PHUM280800 [Pediculus humanus corporis]EEB14102.1 conserved hypothetical protein [Pediculus humanus corporis]
MADVSFSSRAYAKMILHCAKYPHCAVNGVLLAESLKTKGSKNSENLLFVDAIPLFHICLHLSPMYEVALTQIDHMAASKGLVIAGYYIANENFRDISSETGHKIADRIAENFPSACLVVIENKKFPSCHGDSNEDSPLIVYQNADGKWKTKDKSSIEISNKSISKTCELMMKGTQDVVDFDNHLDDISLDWWNDNLNKSIEAEDCN